jgi:hypothetical protein
MWISEAGTIHRWFSGAYLMRSSGHILLSLLHISGWVNRSLISWLSFCAVRFLCFFAYVLMTYVTYGMRKSLCIAENLCYWLWRLMTEFASRGCTSKSEVHAMKIYTAICDWLCYSAALLQMSIEQETAWDSIPLEITREKNIYSLYGIPM